jgi:aldehyde oxidoreductase
MGALATAHKTLEPWGIAPDKIKLVMCDTAITPNSGPAGGSRSQTVTGQAIKAGCEMLLNAMKKPGGTYRTYEEMVAEKIPLRYSGKWTASACTPCDENGQGNPFPCYMYGMFVSGVSVDTKTGKVKVDKMTLVADVGKLANKLVVDGQIYGGLVQGVGLALTEDFEDLKKHTSLVGCGLPYAKDAPDMDIIYVETPRPYGPHGAAGVGELPLSSPHASIVNAIYNACGVRIRRLPALPEKVLAGLQAKK